MTDSVLVSLIIGGAGLSLTIAGIVYSHGTIRGKQEEQAKGNEEFKAEVRKKLNGLPAAVGVLEAQMRDMHDRETRHKLDYQREMDELNRRIDRKANKGDA